MQQVGKYQLVRKLATGGMAEVFLAKAAGPMGFEKTLVLKRILPHLAEETAFVEMFLSEAKLAAQLTHPNIVQIFDFGESEGTYFLAMEYIDGPSLRTLIKRASAQGMELPLAVCARLVANACEGLAFAHDFADPETGEAQGLIHRDISPDNILLSKQGAVKVVDFGIAKAAGQAHKTASGVIKGKLAYMPPEQVRAESLDRRVDVYALGVVLYELLTGHKPYEAESDVGLMRAILFQSLMPAVQFRPELPDSMRRIMGRALAKDREQRYPDCHALQSDLEEFILSVGRPVTTQQVAQLIAQVAASTEMSTSQPGVPRAEATHSVTPVHTPPPPDDRTEVEAYAAPRTVPLRQPAPVKEVPAAEAPRTVQVRKPQPGEAEVAEFAAPQTVQVRKPQSVKEDAPEANSERPTAPDIRPLPPVRRPSMEVISAERKPDMPPRGGRWRALLTASALIVAGVGLVLFPVASSMRELQERPPSPAPQASALVMPSSSAADAKEAPPAEQPHSASSSSSTGSPGTQPQEERDVAAAAEPQDAGVAQAVAPSEPETAPQMAAPLQAKGQVARSDASKSDRPSNEGGIVKSTPRAKAPAPKLAKGLVEFRIRPYATVFLSGRELGDTPLDPVELLAGNYTVKLVNKDIPKTVTLSIRVVAGDITVVRHNFLQE
ncbi:MAG TPA: protein kinase [Archangium sp.]|uniref:serine/threonine protein kinase n=1 Tax=Archangium sp. TaxID=1872627 RepID=UPI002E310589|nr:protein kinase [Archangium sp.]HEX5746136.1 protein kinase [Archangium sp.]